MTITDINDLPPIICWIIARNSDGSPVSKVQMMKATGWSRNKVCRIRMLTTWDAVSVKDAITFLLACGITRANWRRQKAYWNRTRQTDGGLAHFRKRRKSEQTKAAMILAAMN